MNTYKPHKHGFTLIELLVVIGIIGIFIGTFGVALSGGNLNTKVETAQFQSFNLLSQARTLAISRSTTVRLAVNNDPTSDGYLREVAILRLDPTDGLWILGGDLFEIRNGVGIVPANEVPAASGITWPDNVVSVFSGTATTNSPFSNGGSYAYIEFTSRGTVVLPGGGTDTPRLAIAPLQPTPDGTGTEFPNFDIAVGVLLRFYGTPVSLDGPETFPL